MASSKEQIGKKGSFLKEDELFEFRWLTSFLKWSNPIDSPTGGHTNNITPHGKLGRLYRFAGDLTELLVRHQEVVAVTATSSQAKVVMAMGGDEVPAVDPVDEVEQEPALRLAENPRDDAFGRIKPEDPKKHAPLKFSTTTLSQTEFVGSVGQWLLERTTEIKKMSVHPRTDVKLGEHASNVIRLVNKTYIGTADDRKHARELLQRYVVLASTAKIFGRVKRGIEKRNLCDFMTIDGESLKQTLEREAVPITWFLRHAQFVSHTLSTIEKDAIEDALNVLKAASSRESQEFNNSDQLDVIRTTSKMMKTLEPLHQKVASAQAIVYDKTLIYEIQTILAAIVLNVKTRTQFLVEVKREAQITKCNPPEHLSVEEVQTKIGEYASTLDKLASEVGLWLRILSHVKQDLRECIGMNLDFIKLGFKIRGTHKQQPVHFPPSSDETQIQYSGSSGAFETLQQTSESGQMGEDDDGNDSEPDTMSTNDGDGRWKEAALQWLDLICLHETALLSLGSKEQADERSVLLEEYIHAINFGHVNATSRFADKQFFVKEYFDKFEIRAGQLITAEEKTVIQNWLINSDKDPYKGYGFSTNFYKPGSEKKGFHGSYHCETMLMTLYLIAKDREDLVDADADADDPQYDGYHLRLPPREITDPFVDALDVLPVSKRCCPACHVLIDYFRDKLGKTKIMYPGNHVVWSACALPPIIPRPAGLFVLDKVRDAARRRFNDILQAPVSVAAQKSPSFPSNDTASMHSSSIPFYPADVSPLKSPTKFRNYSSGAVYPNAASSSAHAPSPAQRPPSMQWPSSPPVLSQPSAMLPPSLTHPGPPAFHLPTQTTSSSPSPLPVPKTRDAPSGTRAGQVHERSLSDQLAPGPVPAKKAMGAQGEQIKKREGESGDEAGGAGGDAGGAGGGASGAEGPMDVS